MDCRIRLPCRPTGQSITPRWYRLGAANLRNLSSGPLGATETARAYPQLEAFKRICRTLDPRGVFRNQYIARLLEM